MKIVFYSHYFAPSIGGVETIVQSLAAGISEGRTLSGEREFDVAVVTEIACGNCDDKKLPFRVVRRPGFVELERLIRSCDVLHAAGPALVPIFLAWILRKPFVIEHHTYQAICPNGNLVQRPRGSICPGHFQAGNYRECIKCVQAEVPGARGMARLASMLPRYWLSRAATVNVSVSNYVGNRHALPRSQTIYHGIEAPLPQPDSPVSRGKLCFAYVGRLVSEKGVGVLVEASRLLKVEGHEFEVVIIGDGNERDKLQENINREGMNSYVSLKGFLTGAALEDALSNVHVLVMPSLSEETAGLAAIEQMIRGRLVIASDIGGLGEVVGGTGLPFVPGSAKSLANCMGSVIRNPSLIDSFGQKARQRANDFFQRERMIDKHAQIYRSLVGNS